MFVISDNNDTCAGMRLAGVEGVVVHTREEVSAEIERLCSDKSVGIILITGKLRALASDIIEEKQRLNPMPLFLEIPDRHVADAARNTFN
ncbi:MAG: V-type ATP synthase subunit F [Candidatus Flemingiibacterium sp.]